MPIRPHLDGQKFDPETIRVMGLAFEMALVALRLADRGDLANEVLARKVMELAKAGERDPERLCEGVLMHLKAYAIDGEVLRTGSGNFSRSGLSSQDNDAIFITDPAVVDAFEGNFEHIWARAHNIGALDASR